MLLYVLLYSQYPFERSGDPEGQAGFARVCPSHRVLAKLHAVLMRACGTGSYACSTAGHALKMIVLQVVQRTVRCQYKIPDSPSVSAECRDMLCNLIKRVSH